MQLAAIILAILVIVGLVVQSFQSLYLARLFRNYEPVFLEDSGLPKCAVVLCLRGCDPGLEVHIEMLLDQDYPDYHVFFVVDHPADPALKIVKEILSRRQPANASVRVVENHPSTCSLMANNHGTVLPELAKEFPVLALVDADATTWSTWLRTLVTPLVNSELTMVFGNRWYMPRASTFASLSRFIWNYGSVQQMVFFKYPWGGSLAMKAELALLPKFATDLKKSFGNDTPMYAIAHSAGMQVAFHPGIMVVNRETTRLPDFFRWISRQMVYGRLYHPTWPAVLATGIVTGLAIGLAIGINLFNLLTLDWTSFGILTSALIAFWVVWVGFVFHLDRTISRMVCVRGEPRRWWSLSVAIKIFLVAPFVQFIFLAGLFQASFMRRVQWRGIDYEIKGPFNVRMVEYRPYGKVAEGDESIV